MDYVCLANILEHYGTKENVMASLKDLVKQALEKKQAEQAKTNGELIVDTGKGAPKGRVTSNKPAKKSAGRGR